MLTAAMLIGSGLVYVLFSESTLQPWNSGCHAVPDAGLKELQTFEEKLPLQATAEDDPNAKAALAVKTSKAPDK